MEWKGGKGERGGRYRYQSFPCTGQSEFHFLDKYMESVQVNYGYIPTDKTPLGTQVYQRPLIFLQN